MRESINGIIKMYRERGGRTVGLSVKLLMDETQCKVILVDDNGDALGVLTDGMVKDILRNDNRDSESLVKAVADLAPTKILAAQNTISLVMALGSDYTVFRFRPPLPYVAMHRTTGDCYFKNIHAAPKSSAAW